MGAEKAEVIYDAEISLSDGLAPQVVSTESKIQLWREAIRRWRLSGLSKSAFCRREGLRINTFNIWLLRLSRDEDKQASVEADYKIEELNELPSLNLDNACEKGIIVEFSDGLSRRRLTIYEGATATKVSAILTKFLK